MIFFFLADLVLRFNAKAQRRRVAKGVIILYIFVFLFILSSLLIGFPDNAVARWEWPGLGLVAGQPHANIQCGDCIGGFRRAGRDYMGDDDWRIT